MNRTLIYALLSLLLFACEPKTNKNPFRYGTFEIPERVVDNTIFPKSVIVRKGNLQIEKTGDFLDTMLIEWDGNFKYKLTNPNPKTAFDKMPLNVIITKVG